MKWYYNQRDRWQRRGAERRKRCCGVNVPKNQRLEQKHERLGRRTQGLNNDSSQTEQTSNVEK